MRVLGRVVTLALITAAMARPVHADDREEARQAFARGQAADKAQDYRAAIEHYLRAYELAPHHFALYNIATDYERLGELRESAEWFKRYVREAPASPELDRVQRLILELKLRPAKLTITTRPPGARVFIDGQYAGRSPFDKPTKGGGRRIAVELDGQRDERDVYLEFGEPKTIDFSLRTVAPPSGPTGTLLITGTPAGARVAVDEQVVGTLPTTRVPVSPGEHRVKVTNFGYAPFETTATVTINETTPVVVTMATEGATPGGHREIQVGYLLGFGGGVDMLGNGGIYLFDFGVRAGQYDVVLRAGKAAGLTSIDVLFRFAIFKTRFSPYLGAGYSYVADKDAATTGSPGGSGFEAVGGLRYDLARSVAGSASVIVETGIRAHSAISTGMTGETRSGLIIPLMASVQYTYGRTR